MPGKIMEQVNLESRRNPQLDKTKPNIKKITDAVLSLPVLPTVTAKILELVDHPNTSAGLLSNIVSKDQVLTAKVLKIANSSFYGFSREIHTIKHAVVVLGNNALKEISLSMSVFNLFKGEQKNKYFEVVDFWKHCIAVGLCSRSIALKLGLPNYSEAFTAGLLHDLGKVVLNQYLPFEFMKVQELVHDKNVPLEDAEEEVFGTHHGQVGYWLASRWKLPVQLAETMKNHHHPLESEEESTMCLIVYLADRITFQANIGGSGRKNLPEMPEDVKDVIEARLGFSEGDFLSLEADLKAEYELKASDLLSEIE